METRTLGRTGLSVGVVGVGTEHFVKPTPSEVAHLVHKALDYGANFFDCIPPQTQVRDALGLALDGVRDKAVLAGHLGVYEDGDQIGITRDIDISRAHFHDLLRRLRTDYVDIINIIFVDEPDDADAVLAPGGLMDLALKLKADGHARYIQVSCHRSPAASKLVDSGLVDSLMFSVNPLFDMLPGDLVLDNCWKEESYHALESADAPADRFSLYHKCQAHDVGIVVMKPYGGGWLFAPSLYAYGEALSPVQCIHYALSRPAVSTVAAGVASMAELDAALAYATAPAEERAFAHKLQALRWKPGKLCLYCNHCLPCPVGIDVGATLRLADGAKAAGTPAVALAASAKTLPAQPEECTSCGVCSERCPFGVDVPEQMRQAAEVLRA